MSKPKIRRKVAFVFSLEGGCKVYSPYLDDLGFRYSSNVISIDDGQMAIHEDMRWSSLTMASHLLLVFFGFCALGELSTGWPYGIPLSSKACIIKRQLIDHRGQLGVSRRQVAEVFEGELRRAGYPLPRLVRLFASWFMPRRGWLVAH